MADLTHLADLINDAIAEADGDLRAAGQLQAVLVEGIGLNIAFAFKGEAAVASTMCEHASAGVFEKTTLAACVLDDAERL